MTATKLRLTLPLRRDKFLRRIFKTIFGSIFLNKFVRHMFETVFKSFIFEIITTDIKAA